MTHAGKTIPPTFLVPVLYVAISNSIIPYTKSDSSVWKFEVMWLVHAARRWNCEFYTRSCMSVILKRSCGVYFKKVDANTSTCKKCLKTVRTSGNKSNLLKHLKVSGIVYSNYCSCTKLHIIICLGA